MEFFRKYYYYGFLVLCVLIDAWLVLRTMFYSSITTNYINNVMLAIYDLPFRISFFPEFLHAVIVIIANLLLFLTFIFIGTEKKDKFVMKANIPFLIVIMVFLGMIIMQDISETDIELHVFNCRTEVFNEPLKKMADMFDYNGIRVRNQLLGYKHHYTNDHELLNDYRRNHELLQTIIDTLYNKMPLDSLNELRKEHLSTDESKLGIKNSNFVIYDKDGIWFFSDLFRFRRKSNGDLKLHPTSMSDIKYVGILTKPQKHQCGQYMSGSKAYRQESKLLIYKWPTMSIVYIYDIIGGDPPKEKHYEGDSSGEAPTYEDAFKTVYSSMQ